MWAIGELGKSSRHSCVHCWVLGIDKQNLVGHLVVHISNLFLLSLNNLTFKRWWDCFLIHRNTDECCLENKNTLRKKKISFCVYWVRFNNSGCLLINFCHHSLLSWSSTDWCWETEAEFKSQKKQRLWVRLLKSPSLGISEAFIPG